MTARIDAEQVLQALSSSFLLVSPDAVCTVIDASPKFLQEASLSRAFVIGHSLADILPIGWVSVTGAGTSVDASEIVGLIKAVKEARARQIVPHPAPLATDQQVDPSNHAALILSPILSDDGAIDAILIQRQVAYAPFMTTPPAPTPAQEPSTSASSTTAISSMAAAAAAADLGTFDYQLPNGPLHFNGACNAFFFLASDQQSLAVDAFFQLMHPDDRERVRRTIDSAIARHTRFDAEFRVVTADDRTRWLRAIGRSSYAPDGTALRCDGIMIDISREKRTEDALRESEEEARIARGVAEHASLVKDEFLSTLSHELRTPLNTILGWTQVLQRSSSRLSDKASTALATIERSARQQARLIDDLLDASAIIAGKIILDLQPVRSNDIIRASVAACAPVAATRNIKIEVTIDEPGIAIEADVPRLQQILSRLLSNAIKFSSDDAVIKVRQFASNDRVIITVTDTGQGIAPAFLPSLFARFTQADGSITRTHMGLGLGLSIVKSLIELHGGHVNATSQGVSHGSVFTIELPALVSVSKEVPPIQLTRTSIDPADLDNSDWPADIVVVDDEPDAGAVMSEILQHTGATVRLASSALQALEMIRHSRPDLLISDIGMPQIDGYQLLRMLRSEESVDQLPLPAIALTAFARPEDKRRAIEAGYLIHLAKPVESADLITAAKLAVRRPHRSIGIKPD